MVKCEIGHNLSCEGNIKVKQSECRDGAKVSVPITVTWRYCNEDTDVQNPVQNLVVPRYKSGIMQGERLGDNVDKNVQVVMCPKSGRNLSWAGRFVDVNLFTE